jgi:uncharacterized phage-like protein YoqJ
MRARTCCFTGHRPDKLAFGYDEAHEDCVVMKSSLSQCVLDLCAQGYEYFCCGMAMGCDIFFAESVLAAKRSHPNIRFIAAIPYRGQQRKWPAGYQRRYTDILNRTDEVVLMGERYAPGCMMRRNRFMVDRSGLLVAVYNGEDGGTKNTIAYAAAKGLTILWFNPETRLWTRAIHQNREAT